MKIKNCKKLGISMVALVITIIVLIILTSAIVINGVNAPKQAQLAVFYSNIDTVQDLVSLEMGNNMIEGAVRGYDDDYKWKGIVEGYGWDENNNVLLEPENGFSKTSEGIGENIEPIMIDLLEKTTIAEGEKSKYYVGESGKVYYKGFEYEEKTYYNKDKKVEEINKPIEPVVVPEIVTREDIVASPTLYYGEKVNYKNGAQPFKALDGTTDLEWRIFYADEENIYITTTIPIGGKSFTSRDAAMKYLNCEPDGAITNASEYINSYAEISKTKNGIPYPMLRDSYNAIVGPGAQNLAVNEETGEVTWTDNSLSGASGTQAGLYIWAYNSTLGQGYNFYWLASPSADNSDRVMVVNCYSRSVPYYIYDRTYGVRPLVCLKSNIQLEKNGDMYNISTQ